MPLTESQLQARRKAEEDTQKRVEWKRVLKIRWFAQKPSFHTRLRFHLSHGHHMAKTSRQTKARMAKHLAGHFTWDGALPITKPFLGLESSH